MIKIGKTLFEIFEKMLGGAYFFGWVYNTTALFILYIMPFYYLIFWNLMDILQKHFNKKGSCPYAPLHEVLGYAKMLNL